MNGKTYLNLIMVIKMNDKLLDYLNNSNVESIFTAYNKKEKAFFSKTIITKKLTHKRLVSKYSIRFTIETMNSFELKQSEIKITPYLSFFESNGNGYTMPLSYYSNSEDILLENKKTIFNIFKDLMFSINEKTNQINIEEEMFKVSDITFNAKLSEERRSFDIERSVLKYKLKTECDLNAFNSLDFLSREPLLIKAYSLGEDRMNEIIKEVEESDLNDFFELNYGD